MLACQINLSFHRSPRFHLVFPTPEHFSILYYQYRYQYLYWDFLMNSTDHVDYLYSFLYYQYLILVILLCSINISPLLDYFLILYYQYFPLFYTVTTSLLTIFHQVDIKTCYYRGFWVALSVECL